MRARGALALAATVCLLASCADETPQPRVAPSATGSTPGTTLSEAPRGTADDAATAASALARSLVTVRSRRSSAGDVQQAAELHQLEVRELARRTPSFRRRVLDRLDPLPAAIVGSEVRAQTVLTAITPVHHEYPPWRIVRPAPPEELLGYYREAERELDVPWTYLAAINLVETRMGRIRGPSTAGAQGPMQFLPSTWARYGAGGDIDDPHDAILAAARLLRAHGAPRDLAGALWHYNPSPAYVQAVTEYARTLQRAPRLYRGYWHWRVLYHLDTGTYLLPEGYPRDRPVLLETAATPNRRLVPSVH